MECVSVGDERAMSSSVGLLVLNVLFGIWDEGVCAFNECCGTLW